MTTATLTSPMFADLLDDAARMIDQDIAIAREKLAALRDLLLGRAPTVPAEGGLAPWQRKRLHAFIEAHLEETITNQQLAELVNLSCGHLGRAFRISFGTTPRGHIIARRVERAAAMMIGTNEPLAEIAAACGFTDQSHLCRMFLRLKGQSPASWRRRSWIDGLAATA